MNYSFWELVHRQKFRNINHLKQVLNSSRVMISQELYYWPVVETPVLGPLFAWWTHWTSFPLILWSMLVANYFCHELHWKRCWGYWCFSAMNFPGARRRIFSSFVQTLPVLALSTNFRSFRWKPLDSTTHGRKVDFVWWFRLPQPCPTATQICTARIYICDLRRAVDYDNRADSANITSRNAVVTSDPHNPSSSGSSMFPVS